MLLVFLVSTLVLHATGEVPKRILQVNLRKEINAVAWLEIQKGLQKAATGSFDAMLINMNTYGGEVLYADSIRTAILNAPMPVYAFINNNAASAGALISVACDRIYMRTSATIGASTVVDATGAAAPDKYQSYMRGIIRATAEAQGKDTIVSAGDTTIRWRRNPKIAEAMVDPDCYIPGVVDSGKVLTLTANEAVANGYCDGIVESSTELLTQKLGIVSYEVTVFHLGSWDTMKGELMGGAFRALLIMLIIAGIWFELQAPGIGLPSLVAIVAALFFFAPLYMDGLAEYWEIIVFVIGFLLLLLEVFVIPGFGLAGIVGILAMLFGLTAALIDNATFEFSFAGFNRVAGPLLLVSFSIATSLLLSIWITARIGSKNSLFQRLALTAVQKKSDGFVGVPSEPAELIGQTGLADTMLRPSGKVRVAGKMYDAVSEFGFIDRGERIRVTRMSSGQVYVVKAE
jgi:membrane-bound serine protease (ClpP class)